MRNLKRFLAVLVVVAVMATSMIPAFAADAELSPIEVVTGLGIVEGAGNGVDDEYLAADTTKIQAAVILLKALGLYEEAINFDGEENFADADEVTWAAGRRILAYLKANPELGWVGNPDGTFDAYAVIEPAQLYKVMLELLGYEQNVDFKWSEVLEKAVEFGMAGEYVDGEGVTNEDMIGIIYEALYTPVKGGTEEDVLLVYLAEINEAIKEKAIELDLIVVEEEPEELTATLAATGAKKLTVTFNQPIDTTKASFVVKKGSVTANVSKVVPAEDKKSVTLELVTKLTEGDYTVTISGLGDPLTVTTKVENERVAKIEFVTDKAVLDAVYSTIVTTTYKVYNQYDEDVTSANTLTFTAGKGSPTVPQSGTLQLEATSSFTVDEKVAVSALHASSNTFATTILTVVPKAQVADVTIEQLYNADGKVPTAGDTGSDYKLIISAKDQYGNDVPYNKIKDDVIVTVSNTSVANIAGGADNPIISTTSIDGTAKPSIALAGTLAEGTSIIRIIPKATGRSAEFSVVVKAASTVDVLSLSAPEIAVAGELVKIPFTAVDQFGSEMTKASDLTSGMRSALTAGGYPIEFKQDYVKNEAYLELDLRTATSAQTVFITGVTGTGKIVSFQVSVVDPAKPVVINNTKDLVVNVAVGGKITLSENNLVAKDQYGRDITPAFGTSNGQYKYVVSTSDSSKVSLTGTEITADDGSVELNGLAKGTSTITVEIHKNDNGAWKEVENSAISFDVKVVEKADIASYELADLGKTYENTDYGAAGRYEVGLTVNGIMADGSKVAVPTSYYSVIINDAFVGYNSTTSKVYSATRNDWGDATTKDIPVIVSVRTASGPVVLSKNITICKEAPALASIELTSGSFTTKEADNVISAAYSDINAAKLTGLVVDAVKAVDQYGKEFADNASTYAYIEATDLPTGRAADLSDVVAGDTFNVIAVTTNGKTITFKVVVK
jgi:hypothetical protein